mgnify:CR=1 FL=1
MGVTPISREKGCVACHRNPGVPTARSACDRAGKAREGRVGFNQAGRWQGARNLGGEKVQGGFQLGNLAKPQARGWDLRGVPIP